MLARMTGMVLRLLLLFVCLPYVSLSIICIYISSIYLLSSITDYLSSVYHTYHLSITYYLSSVYHTYLSSVYPRILFSPLLPSISLTSQSPN